MFRQIFDKSALVVLLAMLAPASALANVSLKNGNFFVGYTDIIYPGGFEPKVERVYNSKASYNGPFGPGWGFEYAVNLKVNADGSVTVYEFGGGAENRFSPVAFNGAELDKAVESISVAAQKAGTVGNAEQLASYKRKLKSDVDFRSKEWEKLREQGRIAERKLTTGTQLHSNRFSYQYITKVADGYVRAFDNGRVEKFDERGKLAKISDKNGNYIAMNYNKGGQLEKLVDNFNRKMFFYYNNQSLIERIEGEGGKKSEYKYNGSGELVWTKDVDGNAYTHAYDARLNMTEIGYHDKTSMQMTYYPKEKNDNIKSVKDRDGTVTDYAYETDPADKGHYSVAVRVKGSDGKDISNSKYEYFLRNKADGEEWTYKLITLLDGDRTETTYNECCGLPLQIKHGAEETAFQYDTKGHVTKKTTPTEVTELAYDPKANKVTHVKRISKVNAKDVNESWFTYDDKGNLSFAKNNEGKGVRLFYDNVGRIKSMMDQNRRVISFKYNEMSKPVEITDPQLGTITVQYANNGEIKKVDSTAGRKIAVQVTSAFQNLLDIIRPAGVSLSF